MRWLALKSNTHMAALNKIEGVNDIAAGIGSPDTVIEPYIDSAFIGAVSVDINAFQRDPGLKKQHGPFDDIPDFSDGAFIDGFEHHGMQSRRGARPGGPR